MEAPFRQLDAGSTLRYGKIGCQEEIIAIAGSYPITGMRTRTSSIQALHPEFSAP
jgi:hypothetical protein